MRKAVFGVLAVVALMGTAGCMDGKRNQAAAVDGGNSAEIPETEDMPQNKEPFYENVTADSENADDAMEAFYAKEPETEVKRKEMLHFVDVYGEQYETEIRDDIEKHDYDWNCLVQNGNKMKYEGDKSYTYRLGVDVSYHQGDIDWKKVRADGYEFAFIRLGFRGYGQEGTICLDERFHEYMKEASEGGLDTGVYFFSQAVNEEEALEEAEFVLAQLKNYEWDGPVVYDPESILSDEARTDDVTGEQFTANTKVFCERIEEEGYSPMIYCNMLWEAFELDLAQLSEYPIWYADYEKAPQTPYEFRYWQYTNTGIVDGIEGEVDINIQFLGKNE